MGNNRKYQVNTSFFDYWTPDSAYIAGWVAGDGCILQRRVILCGSHLEADHLQSMLFRMSATYPLRDNGSGALLVEIGSLKMVSALEQRGFHKAGPETVVPVSFAGNEASFIRGYLDSDGCVLVDNRGHLRASLGGIAHSVVEFVYRWLSSRMKVGKLCITAAAPPRHPQYKLHFHGSTAQRFLDLVQPLPGELYLSRKWVGSPSGMAPH